MSESFIDKIKRAFGLRSVNEYSSLEKYCSLEYKQINDISYKNKRSIKGLSYNVFLNELITPNSWCVQNLLRKCSGGLSVTGRVRSVGTVVSRLLRWVDDKNLDKSGDYYLYPAETITLKEGDCEDHAFVMASLLPECVGVAYGYWNGGGHAFNVFVVGEDLYVADTVSDECRILKYEDQEEYVIHYIITGSCTFAVDESVQFGYLAGWE